MKRRRLTLPGAVLLGLVAACGTASDEETLERPTDPAERGAAVVEACEEFYEGEPSLAERAEDARDALGGTADDAALAQVEELAQELGDLARDAHTEVAPLLAGVNAVFIAVAEADGETDDLLDEMNIAGSETSQEQFRAACAENGYDAP